MAEMPAHTYPPDAIVALGLELEADGRPKPELLQRVSKAFQLFTEYSPDPTDFTLSPWVIMSGRHSLNASVVPPYPESTVMKLEALNLGIPAEKILEESQSLCTFGNALLTRRLLEGLGLRKFILTSTAYHLFIGDPAFRHICGPGFEIRAVASSNESPTPTQINYQKSAGHTLEAIVESTEPGDLEAIQSKLSDITPAYKQLFYGPASVLKSQAA